MSDPAALEPHQTQAQREWVNVYDPALKDTILGHLIRCQQHWNGMLGHTGVDAETRQAHTVGLIHDVTAAYLLIALAAVDPSAAAAAASELEDILGQPAFVGSWVWDTLTERGVDPEGVPPMDTARPQVAVADGEQRGEVDPHA